MSNFILSQSNQLLSNFIFSCKNTPLPLSSNKIHYTFTRLIDDKQVLFLISDKQDVKEYVVLDARSFLSDIQLMTEIFGDDYKLIFGMVFSSFALCNYIHLLIDSNFIKLNPEYYSKYLIGDKYFKSM
jgi:hypothetical protein